MSLEMEDYQKSLEALQTKLAEKEKALQDSQDEVSRVDKRADDFKTQIGEDSLNGLQKTLYYKGWASLNVGTHDGTNPCD